jgi:hypothetical protein
MDKLKGYLGLALAAFLSIFFISFTDSEFRYSTPITKLDSTAVTHLTVARTEPFKMWRQATDFMNRCGNRAFESCQDMSRYIDHDTVLGNMNLINQRHPGFWELFYADSKLQSRANNPEYQKFTQTANRVYAKYLDEIKPSIRTQIWIVNVMWLGIIIMCLIYRRIAGGFVWAPFALILNIISGGAKVAKKVHDKV